MMHNDLTFLSAQHITTYYLWQLEVCVFNLHSQGVHQDQIHVLFATCPDQRLSEEDRIMLASIRQLATVFFYEDDRQERNYPSSVRPHVIAKHFLQFPQLEKATIFYHDCDIFFRELPPLLRQLNGDTWYVSDTAGYLDSHYLQRHIGEKGLLDMCGLVGVDALKVREQDADCGGAQYIMNKLTAAFWQKVEKDSEAIFTFLQKANREQYREKAVAEAPFEYGKNVQSWCADMWAVLWNALYFKHAVKVHPDLAFSWPKRPIESWRQNYILHNAGVVQEEAEQFFYKGNYIYHTPFSETFNFVDPQCCSVIYAEAVAAIAKPCKGLPLLDFSFLIPVMVDSDDRLDNLYTTTRYLQKHFGTRIFILEYGKQQQVNPAMLPRTTTLEFVQGDSEVFHRTSFNNRLIEMASTPFIVLYDTDVILPVCQLMEAAQVLRTQESDVVYPYDGSFLSMDKLSSAIFSKFLDDRFLMENAEKYAVSSRRSVGGCVMLGRESYRRAGKENEKFTSWGPEDVERYNRMKILGYTVKRVEGPLYHMYHERGRNSCYNDQEVAIAFLEEYAKVFNMKKRELEKYVSNW